MVLVKTTNEGREIKEKKCWNFDSCGNKFLINRKDKQSCSNRCAQRRSPAWQNRNKKPL